MHKLIKWYFVTHGYIDGYSHLITYQQCANDNHTSTVFELFIKIIDHYGLPQKVRTDLGIEKHRGVEVHT